MNRAAFISIIVFVNFFSTMGFGQNNDSVSQLTWLERIEPVFLKLSPQKAGKKHKPSNIAHFEVLDARPDSIGLGAFTTNGGRRIKQCIFKNSVENELATYFNRHFTSASGRTHVKIVLKKLWISDYEPEKKLLEDDNGKEKIQLRFMAECYVKVQAGYVPLIRYDTIMRSLKDRFLFPYNLLETVFKTFVHELNGLNTELTNKPANILTAKFIDSFNSQSFSFPVYRDSSIKKGVYRSLIDFKNNNPGNDEFEIRKEKNFSALYLKDKQGNFYHTRNLFGFCDGYTMFIMLQGNLFPVQRRNNSFYILGTKNMKGSIVHVPIVIPLPGAIAVGSMPVGGKTKLHLKLFTIDMETGEIY